MSVRAAALLAMFSQYISFAIGLAASIYLARYYIDPEALGLFTIAFAATQLIALFQDFGVTRYIAGEKDLTPERIHTAFTLSLLIAWAIAALAMLGAWPISWLYGLPGLLPVMLVIGASYIFVPFAIVPMALRQREMDFASNTMVEVGTAAANAAVSILLAMRGLEALALAWGAFAQQVARAVIAQWRNGLFLPLRPRFEGMAPILHFGTGSSALVLSGALGGRIPELLLGRLLNEAAVGLYSRALGLAGQLRQLVSGAVASVFYPAFARVRDRGEPLGPPYERVVACYCGVTWPAMAGLALVSEPLIRLVYGEAWLGAAPLLRWIALSQMCFVALPLHVELPILLGRMKALVHRNLLDTLASVVLLALGAWQSLEWAAASRLAYGLVWIAIYAGFLSRIIGFSGRNLLTAYLRSGLATLASIAPLALIFAFWREPSAVGFGELLIGTGLGIALWLLVLVATRHPLATEIRGMAEGPLRCLRSRRPRA